MIKEIKINNLTHKVIMKKEDRFIGIKGENKYETLKFTFEDEFLNGEGILEIQKPNSQKEYIILDKEEDCYLLEVKNSLLNLEGEITMQLVVRLTDNKVFKSVEFTMQVLKAIEATVEIPDEYETWDSTLAAKILEIDSKLEEVTSLEEDLNSKVESGYFKGEKGDTGNPGQNGQDGMNGVSPTVSTQTVENGVKVTVTDLNGEHEFIVLNGKDGQVDEQAVAQAVQSYLEQNPVQVPTKTSDLTNDSNYISDVDYVHTDNNYTAQEKQKLAGLSNYDDTKVKQSISNLNTNKADRNEIPDVSNFITKTVNDLTNYYLKNDTYTKQEVNTLIGQIATISIQVVQALPQSGQANIIYFVPKTGTTNDIYNEYIYVNNAYELIGSTQVDLTGYAKIEDIPTNLSDLTDDSTHRTVTDTEKTSWNNKSNFSGDYNDLSNKPTIPSEVTESTVSNWGFTKNTGTITGITMNGVSKGTSGVVDLGTVITQHQDISGKFDTTKVKNANSTTAGDVYDVRYINSMIGNIETLLQEV